MTLEPHLASTGIPQDVKCLSCGKSCLPIGVSQSSTFFLGTICSEQLFSQLHIWEQFLKPQDLQALFLYDLGKFLCGSCADAQVKALREAVKEN